MLIKKSNKIEMAEEIRNYAIRLDGRKISKSVFSLVKDIYNTLSIDNIINADGIYMECDFDEIDNLVSDYVCQHSKSQDIYMVAMVGDGVSIEAFSSLKEFENIVHILNILPNNHINSRKISIFVTSFTNTLNSIYDVDYALRLLA